MAEGGKSVPIPGEPAADPGRAERQGAGAPLTPAPG